MTQTVLQLIKLLQDKGLPVTTAALLNKKAPTEAGTSDRAQQKISTKARITNQKGLVKYDR